MLATSLGLHKCWYFAGSKDLHIEALALNIMPIMAVGTRFHTWTLWVSEDVSDLSQDV